MLKTEEDRGSAPGHSKGEKNSNSYAKGQQQKCLPDDDADDTSPARPKAMRILGAGPLVSRRFLLRFSWGCFPT
jgi:hypothetical protein